MNILKSLMSGGVTTDPYFKNNILLLHGDGTNGAQNNTFLDSSSNNFTITRNGNTTQGTFSPFSKEDGKWGNYFDGTGDYLSVASNAAFGFGTGDFTVEFWIYATSLTTYQTVVATRESGNPTDKWTVGVNSSGSVYLYSDGFYGQSANGAITKGTWIHVAVVRSSGTIKTYVGGTQSGASSANTQNFATSALGVGAAPAGTEPMAGHVSNLRILKGTAQYTANFTPPTSPLTAITNTSLLCCQSNRFKDNSSNAFAITPSGDAAVTPFSPFANSAAYSAATNGGSGYFDGTGDWVQTPADVDFQMGSGDFTIECWHYDTGTIDSYPGLVSCSNGWESGSVALRYNNLGNGKYGFYLNPGDPLFSSTNTFPKRCWNHVAVVRSGTTITMYVNGASEGSATSSATVDIDHTGGVRVGRGFDVSSCITGYVSSVRILKGTAQYTGAFTPATAPFTAITNTSLLLNFTNAGIYDNTGTCDLETVGNAQISTSVKKYGTGSMSFDGTGDYLSAASNSAIPFRAGDFTVEAWVYVTASSTYYTVVSTRDAGGPESDAWVVGVYGPDMSVYVYSEVFLVITSASVLSTNTWAHIAVTRSGTAVKVFVNGVQSGSTGTSSHNFTKSTLTVAANKNGSEPFSGYIDDLRITKGYARYTANFTPPTAAFPDQ